MKMVKCNDKYSTNLTYGMEYEVLDYWTEKSGIKPYNPYSVYLVIDDTGSKSVEPQCIFDTN